MPPISIFRFSRTEGPGYLAEFLDRARIPWQVVALDAGEPVPATLDGIPAIALMGGPMSVNDDLPWVAPMEALLRAAVAADLPVLGNCLGGQLLSRALGAPVTRSPNVEIGWQEVRIDNQPVAREWLGDMQTWTTFHWHNESFALPDGATRVLTNAACPNQAWVRGNSIALQCHAEMTPELIGIWLEDGAAELERGAARARPYVQSAAEIGANPDARLAELRRIADRIYTRWIAGIRR